MALPGMGPEVADAYIEVHADTKRFRKQLQQRLAKDMVDFSKRAQRTFEQYLDMDKAADWETFHRNLAQAARSGDFSRLQRQFKDTGDWVKAVTDRLEDLKDVQVEHERVVDDVTKTSSRKLFKVREIEAITKAMQNYVKELEQADRVEQVKKNTLAWIEHHQKTSKAIDNLVRKFDQMGVKNQQSVERQFRAAEDARARYEKQTSSFYTSLAAKYERDAKAFEAAERQKQETRDRMARLHATALRQQTTMEQDAAAENIALRRRIIEEMVYETRSGDARIQDLSRWTSQVKAELHEATEYHRVELGVRQGDWDRYVNYLRSSYLILRAAEKRDRDLADKEEADALEKRKRRYSVFFDPMRKSRSEFIHGTAVLLDWISTAVGRTGDAVAKFFSYFKPGEGGFRQMFADFGDFAGKMGSNWQAILITIGAILQSLGTVAALTGIIVSLASGLLGIVTAVASSLGMALVSLVPLAGVLTGLGYGLGLLTAAFKDMDRYLPGVSGALRELRRVFTDVDVPAFAAGVAGPLRDLFTSLAKSLEGDQVAGALGRAFGGIVTALNNVVNSNGWKAFMRALETTIPSAIEKFGTGFGGVLQGLFSSFAAGGPAVEKMGAAFATFGTRFAETMDRMDKSGRLDEIFGVAADSMIAISDLAWAVGEALVGLFTAAAPAGNDMLTSLTGIVRKFTEWVTSAEGQNKIEEWMQHAKDVADKVWDILKEVGGQLERLDTPENRRWAVSLLNLIRGIVVGIGNIIYEAGRIAKIYETANQSVIGFFQGIGRGAGDAGNAMGEFWQSIMDGWNGFLDGWNGFWGGVSWGTLGSDIMEGFKEGVSSAASGIATWFADLFRPYIDAVKELFGVASPSTVFAEIGRDIVAGFKQGIQQAWGAFITWATGKFQDLVNAAQKAWDDLRTGASESWQRISTAVRDRVEEIRSNLSAKWDAIRTTVTEKAEAIRSAISTKWSEIRSAVSSRMDEIQSSLSAKWESVRGSILAKVEEIRSGVSSKIGEIASVVGGLPSRAVAAIGKVGGALWGAGVDLIQGFLNGMNTKINAVVATAASMASKAAYAVQKRLLIKSPSKVFERLGMFTAQGFQEGLEKQQAAVQAALVRMVAPPNINTLAFGENGPNPYTGARTINVSPGAIQITTRATDPRLAASMVLDGMATRMMGV